jgi:uncharacterized membrane protein (UPF0127 family)
MFTWLLYKITKFEKKQIRIKGRKFSVLIADTLARGAVGLMYRPKIKENEGMLFIFPFKHRWRIWMLNMRFPLDVIWLDADGRVVHIENNLQPCSSFLSCMPYAPKSKAKYVLELNSGCAKKLGIKEKERILAGL